MRTKLRRDQILTSDAGTEYRIEQKLGEGGFGEIYEAWRLSSRGRQELRVCVKVCDSRRDWHGEAYFGQLLAGRPRVVELLDAFVQTTGSGRQRRRHHVLIFEFMDGGTVADWISNAGPPWSEPRARREIGALLAVLADLHDFGITHRDLKPDNVYIRRGRLVLGDFGIARLSMDRRGSVADQFTPYFAPPSLALDGRFRWGPADDVFQVGALAITLLTGRALPAETINTRLIAALPAGDAFKSWIWHATGARSHRYLDAADALHALRTLVQGHRLHGRPPRSLTGQRIVFSGTLAGLPRREAAERARRAGAFPQTKVNGETTVLVLGKLKAGTVGEAEGIKLFSARERARQGQDIRVISQNQFERLAPPR